MARKLVDPKERRPTLVDSFVSHRYTTGDPYTRAIPTKLIKQLQGKAQRANKFVFDDSASERMGDVVRDIPDLVVRESQFARAPYGLTWVEFNSSLFWRTVYRDRPNKLALAAPDHAARVGFIIDENDAYVIAGGTAEDPNHTMHLCHPAPFVYELNTDQFEKRLAGMTHPAMRTSSGVNRFGQWINEFFWGSTAELLTKPQLDAITRNFCFTPLFDVEGVSTKVFNHLTSECVGDLRNIVVCLLMLNRPSITQYRNVLPRASGWLKNRVIPYMSHTTVSISIDPVPVLRLLGTAEGEGIERRRHEVKGHYCHNKEARDYMRIAGCIHEWSPTYEDWTPVGDDFPLNQAKHWMCSICEGKRWWRDAHERGTAEVGFVAKDLYEVEE